MPLLGALVNEGVVCADGQVVEVLHRDDRGELRKPAEEIVIRLWPGAAPGGAGVTRLRRPAAQASPAAAGSPVPLRGSPRRPAARRRP